jgi:signal transduction histidine kinase
MREAAISIPIVIMTSTDETGFAERMVALGAQDYLVKGEFTGPMLWRSITYSVARMALMVERETLVAELRISVEVKNRMLGILAHDLRNPIGAVSGYAELLEMTEGKSLSTRMMAALTAIRESAAFMNDMIEEVLAFALADAGDVKVNRRWLNLAAVAGKAVTIGAVIAEKKQVRLVLDAQPVWAVGDAAKIEQVLNNLISNAIKFSKAGDVVTVSVTEGDDDMSLSVSDQGGGIPPDVMVNLFKPFVKGKTGTAGERSNGLGLYICSRIIEAHGGRIDVNSKEGRGTTFTVILPDNQKKTIQESST